MLHFETSDQFVDTLLERFFDDQKTHVQDNFDWDRFSADGVDRSDIPYTFLHKEAMLALTRHSEELWHAFELLADAESRSLFIDLLRYRLSGHKHVKLPTNTPAYHELVRQSKAYPYASPKIDIKLPEPFALGHYVYTFEGVELKMDIFALMWPFLIRQYFFQRDGVSIKPDAGDHVIDAGAGVGDTALAFGACAGPQGLVTSFEVMGDAVRVCEHNFAMNSRVCSFRVIQKGLSDCVVDLPLCKEGGFDLGYQMQDAGVAFPVTTLDALLAASQIECVDFIKMDIEGSELKALKGAEQVLRRFRPKLAISLYHKVQDFYEIPIYLDGLGLGYRFYLDHYTLYAGETVLYAIV